MGMLQHVLLLAVVISCWSIAVKCEREGEVVDSLHQDGANGLFPVKEASRHGRVKRQTLTSLAGAQLQMVLDALNAIRSNVANVNTNPTASNMEQLQWSSDLQTMVDNYAGTCVLTPNPTTTATTSEGTFNNLGELIEEITITGTPGVSNYLDVIETWRLRGASYAYPDTTGANDYRQIITADAMYVACTLVACMNFPGATHQMRCVFSEAVSNADPPYQPGTPCTMCNPTTSSCCVEDLCAVEEACVTTTASAATVTEQNSTEETQTPMTEGPTTAATTTTTTTTTTTMAPSTTTMGPASTTESSQISLGLTIGLSVAGFLISLVLMILLICCCCTFCCPRQPGGPPGLQVAQGLRRTPGLIQPGYAPQRPFSMPYAPRFRLVRRPYPSNIYYQ